MAPFRWSGLLALLHSTVALESRTGSHGHKYNQPVQFIAAVNRTQPLNLPVFPACGSLSSEVFTEVNTGVELNATKTIVAFGDSWTSNGSNGTVPFPPIVFPPNPSAGARPGNNERARASNGYTWAEALGNTLGAKVIDYAVGGAVVDLSVWNSTKNGPTYTSDDLLRVGFVDQTRLFLQQGRFLSDLDPDSTLYAIAFGINDRAQYLLGGGDWTAAANSFIKQIEILQAVGARNFLVHWVYFSDPDTNTFQSQIFGGLQAAHAQNRTNFATVNLAHLFYAVNSSMHEFGYTNYTCLASQNTTDFGCTDPDRAVFYIPGHPSAVTHELITQYSIAAAEQCDSK